MAELERDPQLRDRVRNAILADDFLALPGIVRQLGARVDQLGERVDQLGARVDQLGDRVDQLGERVGDLGLQVAGLASQVAQLVLAQNQLTGKVTNMDGRLYEFEFERKIGPWLGPRFRRARILSLYDIEAFDEAVRSGKLTPEEAADANDLDLIVHAEDRAGDAPEAILAFEVSITVDPTDVLRASRRAELLRRCGIHALAAVAGDQITREASDSVAQQEVLSFVRRKSPAA